MYMHVHVCIIVAYQAHIDIDVIVLVSLEHGPANNGSLTPLQTNEQICEQIRCSSLLILVYDLIRMLKNVHS